MEQDPNFWTSINSLQKELKGNFSIVRVLAAEALLKNRSEDVFEIYQVLAEKLFNEGGKIVKDRVLRSLLSLSRIDPSKSVSMPNAVVKNGLYFWVLKNLKEELFWQAIHAHIYQLMSLKDSETSGDYYSGDILSDYSLRCLRIDDPDFQKFQNFFEDFANSTSLVQNDFASKFFLKFKNLEKLSLILKNILNILKFDDHRMIPSMKLIVKIIEEHISLCETLKNEAFLFWPNSYDSEERIFLKLRISSDIMIHDEVMTSEKTSLIKHVNMLFPKSKGRILLAIAIKSELEKITKDFSKDVIFETILDFKRIPLHCRPFVKDQIEDLELSEKLAKFILELSNPNTELITFVVESLIHQETVQEKYGFFFVDLISRTSNKELLSLLKRQIASYNKFSKNSNEMKIFIDAMRTSGSENLEQFAEKLLCENLLKESNQSFYPQRLPVTKEVEDVKILSKEIVKQNLIVSEKTDDASENKELDELSQTALSSFLKGDLGFF